MQHYFDERLASAELIHSAETVADAVRRVAGEITEKLAGTDPLLLCVMSGGVPFAGHLMTQLQFPLEFDYLHVTRGRGTVLARTAGNAGCGADGARARRHPR
mgnify:CR=1 FL=1